MPSPNAGRQRKARRPAWDSSQSARLPQSHRARGPPGAWARLPGTHPSGEARAPARPQACTVGWPHGSDLELVCVVLVLAVRSAESEVSQLVSGSAGFELGSLFLTIMLGTLLPHLPQAGISAGIISPNPRSITPTHVMLSLLFPMHKI